MGRFLLQQRDDITGIIHPGKVGLFGGHREGDEAYLECIVREIYEEIRYFVPAELFEYLAGLHGIATDIDGGSVRSQFFIARDIPAVVITEGSLLIVKPSELAQMEHKLTPSARFAMKAYICKRRFAERRSRFLMAISRRCPSIAETIVADSSFSGLEFLGLRLSSRLHMLIHTIRNGFLAPAL